MVPHADDPTYLLKELKVQAQQGRDLVAAALFFNCLPRELDEWCRANTPSKQGYAAWAGNHRSKYESDILYRQQKLALEGSPVAQRAILGHLKHQEQARARQARQQAKEDGDGLYLDLGEDAPAPGKVVYVGPHLLDTALVLTVTPLSHYNYQRRRQEHALVINPGAGDKYPYANLRIAFATRAERDQAQHDLDQARLENQASPLELYAPASKAQVLPPDSPPAVGHAPPP